MPDSDLLSLYRRAPFCPAPDHIVHSHWMSHLPFAFWLVEILKPRIFVELGAYQGASFCAFCQQIEHLGLTCEAYAVDTWQGDDNMGPYGDEVHARLEEYVHEHYFGFASLLRMTFDDALKQFDNSSVDLLHIDGFHSCEAIVHDFESWLPKVSDKGVVLIHDIKTRLAGYGGVSAWNEISKRYPVFAFRHGYGLGVVLVGQNVPTELKKIAALPESGLNDFCACFQTQGKIYEKLFGLQEKFDQAQISAQNHLAETAEKLAEADLKSKKLEDLLHKERLEHANERDKLKDAIVMAELKALAYENSLSWKLTGPLRKITGKFRR